MQIDPVIRKRLFKGGQSLGQQEDEGNGCKDFRYPTVSPSVNWALEGGLLPGRSYCFFGPESAGKTMFAFSCCVEMLKQNQNGVVIWFDVEKSLDSHWMSIFMLDQHGFTEEDRKDRFIHRRVDYGSQIFDRFLNEDIKIHDEGVPILVCVVDSIQQIIPPQDASKISTEDCRVATLSKYLSDPLKKIRTPSIDRGIIWIFLSQVRDVFDPIQERLGKKYELTGGKSLQHSVDAVMLFEKIQGKANTVFHDEILGMDDKPLQIGHYIKMMILDKCRVGKPKRPAKFKFIYDKGIVDQWEEIANLAVKLKIVDLQGKTYFFKDNKIGVGLNEYNKKVQEDIELQKQIFFEIMESSI